VGVMLSLGSLVGINDGCTVMLGMGVGLSVGKMLRDGDCEGYLVGT